MAKRDKLTEQQQRQVVKTQQRKIATEKSLLTLGKLGQLKKGLLVSRYGEQADVLELADKKLNAKKILRCFLRQNLSAPVAGDRVNFRLADSGQGVIETIETRTSLLQRPSAHQGLKPVVANIDQVLVLVSPLPDFSSVLLDRYLVAIENAKVDITIVANKWDLTSEIEKQAISQQLSNYSQLGYPVIKISTKADVGKKQLLNTAKQRTSILVGQSGVGKSSVINWLFPSQSLLTKKISVSSRLGQHTTTTSQLFFFSESLVEEGLIIDSPGIREFGLWHLTENEIAYGFREFKSFLGHCKYRDCQHLSEPCCALNQAVKEGNISLQRWQNYKKIIADNLAKA